MRPLTSLERSQESRLSWRKGEEKKARETRGEQGAMEFRLRVTRAEITKEAKAGRTDVWAAFALVLQLFRTAMQRRAEGDVRIWNDLLQYADQVVQAHPPRD